jgi:hypothetical protein
LVGLSWFVGWFVVGFGWFGWFVGWSDVFIIEQIEYFCILIKIFAAFMIVLLLGCWKKCRSFAW